ncbi:unnamed protein product [Linum tenue]|uniref:Uncharacterized protein n=1 Tax=Linum tenue TaxID=586396 RepID=A0AAV0ML13_9ROSI|nr:unnamed protein product [Linum tenue]
MNDVGRENWHLIHCPSALFFTSSPSTPFWYNMVIMSLSVWGCIPCSSSHV